MENNEILELIEKLEKISFKLMRAKKYFSAGQINLAIDELKELIQ